MSSSTASVLPRDQGSGNSDQASFDELVTTATGTLSGDEVLLANVSGERTDFIRLNNSEARQAGTVEQRTLTVDLIDGQRHTGGSFRLSGDRSVDDARLAALLGQLREQRSLVADDPFLLYNTEPNSTERIERGSIPEPDAALAEIRSAGRGRDLVGIYASGDTFQGFANSLGQRNWFQSSAFNLDWCFYLRADKAAKNLYAGFDCSCCRTTEHSDCEPTRPSRPRCSRCWSPGRRCRRSSRSARTPPTAWPRISSRRASCDPIRCR